MVSLVDLATIVGGFSTGVAVLVALPIAYFQVREQGRFTALTLFADHFGKVPELLMRLAGGIKHSHRPSLLDNGTKDLCRFTTKSGGCSIMS